jgi:hypothetical protein
MADEDPFAAAIQRGKERQMLNHHQFPVQSIDDAIDSYPAHVVGVGDDGAGAPYDRASLAEIYAPRVQQLFELQNQGFTHAQWKHDEERGENRWHGVEHNG